MDESGKNFVISVDGQDICCDKEILAQQSDYFRALFNSSMTECERNSVTLNDVSYETTVALVECMKTGELKISEDDVIEITQAAVRFQVIVKKILDNEIVSLEFRKLVVISCRLLLAPYLFKLMLPP